MRILLKTLWEKEKMLVTRVFSTQCFINFPKQISVFSITFIISSSNALYLDQSNFLSSGTELTLYLTNTTSDISERRKEPQSFENIVGEKEKCW